MSRHGTGRPDDAAWERFRARGKPVSFAAHALDGMAAERERVRAEDAVRVLDEPDHDNGKDASKWVGRRTIKVYYIEEEDRIFVRGVSATRRRFRV